MLNICRSKVLIKTFFLFLIIIFGTIYFFACSTTEGTIILDSGKFSSNDRIDKALLYTNHQSFTFSTPTINPTYPGSSQSTNVNTLIDDPDGIKNATLFWQFSSINDTIYNTTMSGGSVPFITDPPFTREGYIDNNDAETNNTSFSKRFGEYTYESSSGDSISSIDLTITRQGGGSSALVYARVEAKNITTGIWQTVREVGNISDTSNIGDVTYANSTPTNGYKIYAVNYKGTNPPLPNLNLQLYRNEYIGVITAPNQPAFVDYHILAFDNLDNSATSDTYTFLADWAPVVSINDVPAAISANQDYVLNVTVTDLDGISMVDTVTAYYRMENEIDWIPVSLSHVVDTSSTSAFYNGTITNSQLLNQETNLLVMVNASDTVGGLKGLEGSSGQITIVADGLAPRVTNIIVEGGVTVPDLENITLASSEVNITAEFTDPAGINVVNIYYSTPNGTVPEKKQMTNMTETGANVFPSTFHVTLPPANETSFTEYFFEPVDYLGNAVNTSVNMYYSDGAAPLLEIFLIHPQQVSNNTNVNILFNASDPSGIGDVVLCYSFDDGITWSDTPADPIDYAAEVEFQQSFAVDTLPSLITNNDTTYLPLEVIRGFPIDTAVLTVEFTHEQTTDLRIWLLLDNSKRFLIFDREAGNNVKLDIDLFDLGLDQSDFFGNFTLELQDFSLLFTGYLTNYKIDIAHHKLPLGYQFVAKIPRTENDTIVSFFMSMTDKLMNAGNSSTYTYYSDGLSPVIVVQEIPSPLDMEQGSYIQIEADVTDQGGLLGVEVYYKFSENETWVIQNMILDPDKGIFVFDVPLPITNGTLIYQVRAYDLSGLTAESPTYNVEFNNAVIADGATSQLGTGFLEFLLVSVGLIGLAGGLAGVILLIRKKGLSGVIESIKNKIPRTESE
ncbi:MAG: hypothetical protein ACXAEU_24595 [Candidatus Hodarchaeales archaeon]|jgi:hypothetical protein